MIFLAVHLAFQRGPITVAPFASWDGKSWAGVAVGTGEKDLRKQAATTKTAVADPASIRLQCDRKGWVATAILTAQNQKGEVAGFAVEAERDEPLESLEALTGELGQPDFTAFPRVRYSDWSVAVWKERGIAAAVWGQRPLVYKVLMGAPATLAANLDLWDRQPTEYRHDPRIPVGGFSITVTTEPKDGSLESSVLRWLRNEADRRMDSYRGGGWEPARSGSQIGVTISIRKKNGYTMDGSLSLSRSDELGNVSVSTSATGSASRDLEVADRTLGMFDDMLSKLPKEIDDKYRRLVWQAEWRPFYALARGR